ncbi:lipoate--protein ligase [Clostridium sp. CX1]|uniref:lipoate--protein ligase n=1 Tax=Clostridium sp. CX1 TaxID=2978346 RepID=UPI0021BE6A55|nr:lipoate--protein ligase [Clostridium sp. CX1]MCT8976707.1 lipoate--protein ligase [Clostridium sp. CX1]
MIFIKNDNTNPAINHAVEEYVLDKFDDDCFMLWRNEPSILVGKNQNTLSEINLDYVREKNIPVIRRMSGGGTIFCDFGIIQFTFISCNRANKFADFGKFTSPVINALKKLEIEAELSGRNDLTIEGRKFSGNAQYSNKNKTLHHGSILFSPNMNNLVQALKVKPIKFEGKAVKSVASRVTNISEHLKTAMTVIEFKNFLLDSVMSEYENSNLYEFSDEEWEKIRKISSEKYETWEWNYGHSPKFNYFNEKKFLGGIVQANTYVYKGIIKDIKLFGDFFSEGEVKELEECLTGIKYVKEDIYKVLDNIDIERYMSNISKENLLSLIMGSDVVL